MNRALELDPSDRWAIKNRGIVLARLSQFDKALADLARHMQIYPHDVDVQRQILDIHLATKNWESAVESITGILEYDPPDSEKLRELRIEGYLSLGRDDEALADCDRCVELKPDKARPVMIRAELLATAGRIEEYRRACSDILKRFSQSGDEWDLYHAARACVILPQAVPDPTEPVKLATQAVSKYPMAWTRYALGMAHLRAGQLDEAEQHFDELSRKTHLYPLCWLGLALVQQERGNAEEARNWLVKAVTRIEACGLYSLEERLEYQLLRREVQQPAAPWNLPAGAPPPAIAPFDAKKAKEHQAAWAKHLGVPVEMTNSIGMKFVLIPPGEFDMGSTEAEVAKLLEQAKATNQPSWYIEQLPAGGPEASRPDHEAVLAWRSRSHAGPVPPVCGRAWIPDRSRTGWQGRVRIGRRPVETRSAFRLEPGSGVRAGGRPSGGERDLERRDGVLRLVIGEGRREVPSADRGAVGVRLPGGDHDDVVFG